MKIKRYKKVNKYLNFYINYYQFRQPYQMLVDGTFCLAALQNQINISDNLPKYLQGELKILTTQCAIIEMENLDRSLSGALQILKKSLIHKCGHEKKPIVGADCLHSMVSNNNNDQHYIVATQDRDLQKKIRLLAGVPLLYLHSRAPVLDTPSKMSLEHAAKNVSSAFEKDITKINTMKEISGISTSKDEGKLRKRKKKGPNPLSCKKKKKVKVNVDGKKETEGLEGVDKKKGAKIRLSKHVKLELQKNAKL